jgi:hypothetical protein
MIAGAITACAEIDGAARFRNKQSVALNFTEGVFMRYIAVIHCKGKVFSAAAGEFINMLTSV